MADQRLRDPRLASHDPKSKSSDHKAAVSKPPDKRSTTNRLPDPRTSNAARQSDLRTSRSTVSRSGDQQIADSRSSEVRPVDPRLGDSKPQEPPRPKDPRTLEVYSFSLSLTIQGSSSFGNEMILPFCWICLPPYIRNFGIFVHIRRVIKCLK